MKNYRQILVVLAIPAVMALLWACQPNPYEEPAASGSMMGSDMKPVIASGTVSVAAMPAGSSEVFKKALTLSAYEIGRHEVTYELWHTVRVWAEKKGYKFANMGWEGHKNTNGAPPSPAGKNMPVAGINWRDALVWCNAYTEWYNSENGTSYTPVYTYRDIDLVLNPPAITGRDLGSAAPPAATLTAYAKEVYRTATIPNKAIVRNLNTSNAHHVWMYNGSSWTDKGDTFFPASGTVVSSGDLYDALCVYARTLLGMNASQPIPDKTSVWNYHNSWLNSNWNGAYDDLWIYNAAADSWTNAGSNQWMRVTTGGGIDYSYQYIVVNPKAPIQDATNLELCNRAELTIANTGFRLPTEAEWEFAARGGSQSAPAWSYAYAGSDSAGEVAWYRDTTFPELPAASGNKEYGVHSTGDRKAPNTLDLYDMSGNVSEWCWDIYMADTSSVPAAGYDPDLIEYIKSSYPTIKTPWPRPPEGNPPPVATIPPSHPTPPAKPNDPGRLEFVPKVLIQRQSSVFRGGSWYHYATECTVAARNQGPPSQTEYTGFRLARSLP